MSEEAGSTRGARGGVPFHCPFCAETDLWPHEPTGWECRGCQRAFTVQLLGLIARKPQGGAS